MCRTFSIAMHSIGIYWNDAVQPPVFLVWKNNRRNGQSPVKHLISSLLTQENVFLYFLLIMIQTFWLLAKQNP